MIHQHDIGIGIAIGEFVCLIGFVDKFRGWTDHESGFLFFLIGMLEGQTIKSI